MIEPMSDEELSRELKHWGSRATSQPIHSAPSIRFSHEKRRTANRRALRACTVIATALIAIASLTYLQRQFQTQREVVMQPMPPELDPNQLLQSITVRLQSIESRIDGMKLRSEEQKQFATEMDELNRKILDYQRIAIRNQIALTSNP